MPVESAADRAAFLSPDEFGDVAVYTPAGGVAKDVAGIFDDPSRTAAIGDMDMGTVDARPTFLCTAAALPANADAEADDVLVVRGRSFVVSSIELDGQGMALLMLGAS